MEMSMIRYEKTISRKERCKDGGYRSKMYDEVGIGINRIEKYGGPYGFNDWCNWYTSTMCSTRNFLMCQK